MADDSAPLGGKTCMITGATSGIGRAAALALAAQGADLVLVCRDRARGEATGAEIAEIGAGRQPALLVGDLSSQADIRRVAAEFEAMDRPLHVLLNNAGVVMLQRTETPDGIETTFAVNHLAYYLLTGLLLERLRASAPARIVCVASDAHRFAGGPLPFDDLEGKRSYGSMKNYGMSKLANILFTRELATRLEGTGVTVNCLHPGMVGTGLGKNNGTFAKVVTGLLRPFSRSPERGAQTSIFLCSSDRVDGVTGGYFSNCRQTRPNAAATSPQDGRRLWDVSREMTGFDPFA